ncbi:MAG: PIN domain-containing protein [Anaerolineae bacterium]|nr:PIN domain-containing protein [Anaerolineae bacterium]
MSGKAFVDTNIVLRRLNNALPGHAGATALIRQQLDDDVELWISRQVIREHMAQVSRPGLLDIPLTVAQIEQQVGFMRAMFNVADETEAVTEKLLELIREFPSGGKQIHDANIVATMLVNGIDTLLTMNVEDMKRFGSRIKIAAPAVPPQET